MAFELNNRAIALTTDLEPDDLLALLLLFPRFKEIYHETGIYPLRLIVVGEGNSIDKLASMKNIMHLMQEANLVPPEVLDHIAIIPGEDSFRNFHHGQQGLYKGTATYEGFIGGKEALAHFMSSEESPLIIALKPLRDLLLLFREGENQSAFQRTEIAGYMSFNMKSLFKYMAAQPTEIERFFDSFKNVLYYERHIATPSTIDLNPQTAPELMQLITKADVPLLLLLKKLMSSWDAFLINEKILSIAHGDRDLKYELDNLLYTELKKDNYDLNIILKKVRESRELESKEEENIEWELNAINKLLKHQNQQMCFADPGLIMLLLKGFEQNKVQPSQGKLFWTSAGRVLETSVAQMHSNIYYPKDLDGKVMIVELTQIMQQLYLKLKGAMMKLPGLKLIDMDVNDLTQHLKETGELTTDANVIGSVDMMLFYKVQDQYYQVSSIQEGKIVLAQGCQIEPELDKENVSSTLRKQLEKTFSDMKSGKLPLQANVKINAAYHVNETADSSSITFVAVDETSFKSKEELDKVISELNASENLYSVFTLQELQGKNADEFINSEAASALLPEAAKTQQAASAWPNFDSVSQSFSGVTQSLGSFFATVNTGAHQLADEAKKLKDSAWQKGEEAWQSMPSMPTFGRGSNSESK